MVRVGRGGNDDWAERIIRAQSPSTPCRLSGYDGSHLCVGVQKMFISPSRGTECPNRRGLDNGMNWT